LGDQRNLQRKGREAEKYTFNEVNDADMDEARDIFGEGFDIFAKEQFEDDEEDEEDDLLFGDEDQTVRSYEERSDELPRLAFETKTAQVPTFVQDVPPP